MWPEGLSEADFKREECRRLVWTCVTVIANVTSYTSATPELQTHFGRLFVSEPENVSAYFSGRLLSYFGLGAD